MKSSTYKQCIQYKKFFFFLYWILFFLCQSSAVISQDTLSLKEVVTTAQKVNISRIVDSIKNGLFDKYTIPSCARIKSTVSLVGLDTTYYLLSDSFYMNYFTTYKGWKYEGYVFSYPIGKRPIPQIDNTEKKQRMRGVSVFYSILENPTKSILTYLDRYRDQEGYFFYEQDTSGGHINLLWFTDRKIIWNKQNEGIKEDRDTPTVVVDFYYLIINRQNWTPMFVQNGAIEISTAQYENSKNSFATSMHTLDSALKEKSVNQLIITSRFELNSNGHAQLKSYEVSDNFSPISFGSKLLGRVPNPEHSTWRLKIEDFHEMDSPQIDLHNIIFDYYHSKLK